uniref:NKG2-FE2 n=1 Tax=Macaca mulatta TaxID=9544 RepID=Q95L90_MACMU|nr:NKG2-FE2 [Macaca mulatta]
MNKQRGTYSEVSLAQEPGRQQRKLKGNKSSISGTEQKIFQEELNPQNASSDHQGNDKTYHCKGLLPPPEKLTAEVLGSSVDLQKDTIRWDLIMLTRLVLNS